MNLKKKQEEMRETKNIRDKEMKREKEYTRGKRDRDMAEMK